MKKTLYIDIGSRTTKAFVGHNKKLIHLENITINFLENYSTASSIQSFDKKQLFDFIASTRHKHADATIKLFCTAFFRKLSRPEWEEFAKEVYTTTGAEPRLLSQEEEHQYLIAGLLHNCAPDVSLLIINVGGGSTEISFIKNKNIVELINLDFGVAYINQNFPTLNKEFSLEPLETIISFVQKRLPSLKEPVAFTFTTGNELSYMKLLDYPLVPNRLFSDYDHPYMIECGKYAAKNQELFESISLNYLESLMPQNPKRMHGARPVCAITQAICEYYHVGLLVPSDVDIIHGIFKNEQHIR